MDISETDINLTSRTFYMGYFIYMGKYATVRYPT